MTDDEFKFLQEIVNTRRPDLPLPEKYPLKKSDSDNISISIGDVNKFIIDYSDKKEKKGIVKKRKKVKVKILSGVGVLAIVSSIFVTNFIMNKMNSFDECGSNESSYDDSNYEQQIASLINDSQTGKISNDFNSIFSNESKDDNSDSKEESITDVSSKEESITDVSSKEESITDVISKEESITDVISKEESITDVISKEESITDVISKEESITDVSSKEESITDDLVDYSENDLVIVDNNDYKEDFNSNGLLDSNVIFEVGTSSDIEDSLYYLNNTIEGYLIRYYSEVYGVDPNLVLAICFQESGGVNLVGEGAANGPMMLEVMDDYDIVVYNYLIGGYETITVSSDYTGDLEYNFKCAIANIRNKIDYCQGNIYAALQAYNYNEITLMNALDANGYVLSGYGDCGWLYITEDLTNNPQKYGIDWPMGEKYGVANYPVYTGYHLPNKFITYNYKDKQITMNYATSDILNVEEIEYNDDKIR